MKSPTVLFVCVHNAGRSQMAEAFFNQLAKGRARAISAGTQPSNTVNPTVIKAMREMSIDLSGRKPRALTAEMMEQANRVVTMGCGVEGICPATLVKSQEDWDLEDPKGQPLEKVRQIRDRIRAMVQRMVEEL